MQGQAELVLQTWGTIEQVPMREGHRVDQFTVNPGARLPVRVNDVECEHWVVVSGTGKMSLDGNTFLVDPGSTSFIPAHTPYSIENAGKDMLRIVAVHYGAKETTPDQFLRRVS